MNQPHFPLQHGEFFAEAVPLRALAEHYGTPAYIYAAHAFTDALKAYQEAFAGQNVLVCLAVKANSNLSVLRLLSQHGAGADCVSGGELQRALAAGINPQRIVLSGVGKSADEIRLALSAGIHQLNLESLPELEAVNHIAGEMGVRAPIGLRVNPDVDAATHHKISTGKAEDKFGLDRDMVPAAYLHAMHLPHLSPQGLSMHIGSSIMSLDPFRAAFQRLSRLVQEMRLSGMPIARLDLGGGIGAQYSDVKPPDLKEYAALVQETLGDLGCALMLEPGKSLTAAAGILLTRVLYIKEGQARHFAIVDAAMNDLIRPTLYEAYHPIWPVVARAGAQRLYDVVGPVCETGDIFASQRSLPPLQAGDYIAIGMAGAYGATMSSSYNSRAITPEILVQGTQHAEIRQRISAAQQMSWEPMAPWLQGTQ